MYSQAFRLKTDYFCFVDLSCISPSNPQNKGDLFHE